MKVLRIFLFGSVLSGCWFMTQVGPRENVKSSESFILDAFPNIKYNFSSNVYSEEKFQLGRSLFYDPILSENNTISCASCHSSFNAFAHTDHPVSHGIYDRIGFRNAPALFNLAWHQDFMWDGAIHHLDVQSLAPISDSNEMNSDLTVVIKRLQASTYYKELWKKAWHDTTISTQEMLQSLSIFMVSLVSNQAKYDRVKMGKDQFNKIESNGYELFKRHCNRCHQEPLFRSDRFERNTNNLLTNRYHDNGRFRVSRDSTDWNKFKVPSLRNLKYSYPYMHDGRYISLKSVLNYYSDSSGILRRPLTPADKTEILAFLQTLNDSSFVFNKQYQFPDFLKSQMP